MIVLWISEASRSCADLPNLRFLEYLEPYCFFRAARLTFLSQATPRAPVITSADGSETYGRAPVTIEYDRDTLEANLGKVPGFVATWPSGAKAATEAPYVVRDFKYGAQIELQRPADAPGLEEDLRFALEQAQERAKRAEADRRRLQLYYQGGWMHGPFFGPGFWYFP